MPFDETPNESLPERPKKRGPYVTEPILSPLNKALASVLFRALPGIEGLLERYAAENFIDGAIFAVQEINARHGTKYELE